MRLFDFLLNLDPKDAVAGVHFAMRSITHRHLRGGRGAAPAGATVPAAGGPGGTDGETKVGLMIVEEIERDAGVRLGELSAARAERYKQALLDTAFELTRRKLGYEKGAGEKLLREWRAEPVGTVVSISIPLPFSTSKSVSVGTYLMLLTAALVYLLVCLWPGTGAATGGGPSPVSLLGGLVRLLLDPETRVLLLVIVMGVLGSSVYAASNYAALLLRRDLGYGQYWLFLVRPAAGALVAPLVYFVFRAGFLQPAAGVEDLNVFGLLALSVLSGMFSEQVIRKLREVSEVMFGAGGPRDRGGVGGKPRGGSAPPAAAAAKPQSDEGKGASSSGPAGTPAS